MISSTLFFIFLSHFYALLSLLCLIIFTILSLYLFYDSPEIEKEYGVVIEIPVDKLEWIKEGNKKEDWSGTYVVFYIDDKDGLADHQHVPEVALRRTNVGSLPDELFFLQEYSDHLKGIKQLPKKIIDNLLIDRIYLKKTNNFYK